MSKLGEGGMATVYLAIQEKLDRKIAVKILAPHLLTNKTMVTRFKREAKAAAMLSHSNIVQIFDTGCYDNYHYIIMEYLETSLKSRIKISTNGKMHPQIALDITKNIFTALDYAHMRGVIHRDLKPDNIMFRQDNNPIMVDFGIAHVFDFIELLTREGTILGTTYYMSPEQCQAKEIDGRSDVYSLGVILYEILTGKLPFKGENDLVIARKHIEEPIPKLSPDLSLYQPLIDRMMAKKKENRFSSVIEFNKVLDRIYTSIVSTTSTLKDFPENTLTNKPKSQKEIQITNNSVKRIVGHFDTILFKCREFTKRVIKNFNNFSLQKRFFLGVTTSGLLIFLFFILISLNKQNIIEEQKFKQNFEQLQSSAFKKTETELINKIPIFSDVNEIKKTNFEFDRYLKEAENYLKNNYYSKALDAISKAKQIKTTNQLLELENKINTSYSKWKKLSAHIDDQEKQNPKDLEAYEHAFRKNTISQYKIYLEKFPKGIHVKDAQDKIEQLKKQVESRKRTVTLRSNYRDISDTAITNSIVQRFNFFESNINKTGSYKSYYEKLGKKNISIVMDYSAGLMWYDEKSQVRAMNFKESSKWLKKLNKEKYGGFTDWRFPTLEEAASLIKKNKNEKNMHIDPIFSEIQAIIWTGDHFSSNGVWVIDFTGGIIKVSHTDQELQIRPVRSIK